MILWRDLDYTELNKTYSTIGRNPELLPETMFAIIVYGYMEGKYIQVVLLQRHVKEKTWLITKKKTTIFVLLERKCF